MSRDVVRSQRAGAVDTVDAAAGGQDLGLHDQGFRNAPGGEVGSGDHAVGNVDVGDFHLVGDLHGTGVVFQTAFGRHLFRLGHDGKAVRLKDGDRGSGVVVTGQVHAEGTVRVVGDQDGNGALRHGGVGLREEGGGAAEADRYFAGYDRGAEGVEIVAGLAHVSVVIHAGAVEQDVFQILAAEGRDGVVAVAGGLGVEHGEIAELQRHAGLARVVNGSDGKRVREGTRGTDGVLLDIIRVDVAVRHVAVVRGVVPGIGVAGGNGNDHAFFNQEVHYSFVTVREGPACHTGTQGQVGRIGAQDDGVFDRDHVVGIGSAARAEHLHRQDLRIRGHALYADGVKRQTVTAVHRDVLVGSRDTRHVRAVVAAGVLMVDAEAAVYVVIAVSHLGIAVCLAAGDGYVQLIRYFVDLVGGQQIQGSDVFVDAHFLLGRVLSQRIFEGSGVKGQMLGVDTGIDDGNSAAGAGITFGPGNVRAGHQSGSRGGGIIFFGVIQLIAVLDENIRDAVDRLDGVDLAIEDVCRDDVRNQSQIPLDVQIVAKHLTDAGNHLVLIAL